MVWWQKIKFYLINHKRQVVAGLIVLLALTWVANYFWGDSEETLSYTLGQVTRGEVTTTVSGIGQVSDSNIIELDSEVSSKVTGVYVKSGQTVKVGDLLVKLDATDAYYDLESAQLDYDDLTIVDTDDLRRARNTLTTAENNLSSSYDDARSALANASADLAEATNGIRSIIVGYLRKGSYEISKIEESYIEKAKDSFYTTDDFWDDFTDKYHQLGSNLSDDEVLSTVEGAYQLAVELSKTVKYTQDAVIYLRDRDDDRNQVAADEAYDLIISLTDQINSLVTNLFNSKDNIINNRNNLADAEADLIDVEDGPDASDLLSSQLALSEKKDDYYSHFITAPYAGTIAKVDVAVGDSVSSGSDIVTLIANLGEAKVAGITLNEVDIAKVDVGQGVILTFDALDEVTLLGAVSEVDLVGEIESGVVSYGVKIVFDDDNNLVKSGMTVEAEIAAASKKDVLMVPNSALKSRGDTHYVEILAADNQTISRVEIEIGLTGDNYTEIVAGLKEGDEIIVKTSTGSSNSTTNSTGNTNSTRSLMGGGGGPPGGVMGGSPMMR